MKPFKFAGTSKKTGNRVKKVFQRDGMCRVRMTAASLAAAFLLSACGGGGDARTLRNFNIGVTVGGQLLSTTSLAPRGSLNLAIHAGQSLILDAGEQAVWTLFVGGSAVSGGAQVYYAGVANPLAAKVAISSPGRLTIER